MLRGKKGGFTLVELLVVISIIAMLMGLLLPAIQRARETGNQNTCRNNMRQLAIALEDYQTSKQAYPGYINVLLTNNGRVYLDQETGQEMPVSWIVELLPQLDRLDLHRIWKQDLSTASQGGSGGQSGQQSTGGNQMFIANPKVYLEVLQCPSEGRTATGGTPTSYVINTGMQDQQGIPPSGGSGGGGGTSGGGSAGSSQTGASGGSPRDWPANGVFHDRYTYDKRLQQNQNNNQLPPMVRMNKDYISRGDGLEQTLMISENVDATDYTFDTGSNNNYLYAEQALGFIWEAGTVDTNVTPPLVVPTIESRRMNVQIGQGDGISYDFVRPSSYHPGGVNVAFCSTRVIFLRDDIPYFVYCLLMTPNGAQAALPGTQAPGTLVDNVLRTYPFDASMLNP